MTVINMISCGNSGIAVADEQTSSYIRKYNVAQKLANELEVKDLTKLIDTFKLIGF